MTTPRDALERLVADVPAGAQVTVPADWIRELLATRPVRAVASVDLTVGDVARLFARQPSTIRGWCEQGRLPGAYRLRQREWRIPPAALDALQGRPARTPRADGGVIDLSGWRDELGPPPRRAARMAAHRDDRDRGAGQPGAGSAAVPGQPDLR
jgi:hypothetical protein